MQCPRCEYQSKATTMQCPQCRGIYPHDVLEELGHLQYTQDRLDGWCEDGTLPARLAQRLLALTDVEMDTLEQRLDLLQEGGPTVHAEPAPGGAHDAAVAARSAGAAIAVAAGQPAPSARPVAPAAVAGSVSAGGTVPLGLRPPIPQRAAPSRLMPPPPPARPASPPRPAFSWKQVGTYLLSERTLNALLGLGAFLILAAAFVISTINPTGLTPLLHLAAMICTTLVFYGAGAFVQQRLTLTRTGAALLAIGAAFVPLDVWTLGRDILDLEPRAIWVLASVIGLPLYLASHLWLRDRAFALLTAIAGGSLVLSLTYPLGVALIWGAAGLVGMAVIYLALAHRLRREWQHLSWALFWTAQIAVPICMAGLLAVRFAPTIAPAALSGAWIDSLGAQPGASLDYAVGTAWWLGALFYVLAARLFPHPGFRYAAAWTVPCAYLFTLTKAPFGAHWYGLCLAALAAAYLLFGRFVLGMGRLGDRRDAYIAVGREPVFQVAGLLTLLAVLWPTPTPANFTGMAAISTVLAVTLSYGAAAFLLGQRAWAYVAAYLVPVAYGLIMARLGLDAGAMLLGWSLLAVTLLVAAEVAARRTGEARRPVASTVLGLGAWRSRFASPLFSASCALSLLAVTIGLSQDTDLSHMSASAITGLLLIVALCAGSSALRRTSLFLYAATWLFLLPLSALAAHAYAHAGLDLTAPREAQLLALLAVAYLALAFVVDRARGHYARPIYLAAYALALVAVALATPDRTVTLQTLGLALLGYVWSAALVHAGRHPAYTWLATQMVPGATARVLEAAEMLFQYLAVWLFPVWLLLLQSLRQPAPAPADYGIALALLAPLYAMIGLGAARIHSAYRLPWWLGAYTLSALGPLATLPDPNLRIAALTISIALYVASALQSRRREWLWLAAALGPALLLEALYRFGDPARAYGIALVALSLGYGALGLVVQRGGVRNLLVPLREPIRPFASPFLATGQAICVIGLALTLATGETGLVLVASALGALQYACAAAISRHGAFSTPLAITLAAVYASGLLYSPIPLSSYGLALLPGLVAFLAIGEVFRRTADAAGRIAERKGVHILDTWAAPFNALLHLGATIAFTATLLDSGVHQALTFWGISSLYFALAALRRRPGLLYPAIGVALTAYLATAALVVPGIVLSVSLVLPVWALLALAHAIARLHPGSVPAPRHLRWSGSTGMQPWTRPLLVWGMVALSYSAMAGATIVATDLGHGSANLALHPAAALAYLVALVVFSLLWRSRALVWGAIAVAALACQEILILAAVHSTNQPVYWAGGALLTSVLGSVLHRRQHDVARLWATPLLHAATAVGVLAIAVAAGNLTLGRFALQPLAAIMAVIGITVLAQGIANRQVPLRYLGLGLLNGGIVCELLFHQVNQPQAFVLPLGLTLLLAAYLEWRRGTATAKALLETAALVLLLGTSTVQAYGWLNAGADRHSYDTFLLLESVAVFGLGAMLRWKRTFFAACAAMVADVVILLADPLGALNTWYLVAIIGCSMIGLVIFLEQRRQQIPLWIDDVRLRLEAWD